MDIERFNSDVRYFKLCDIYDFLFKSIRCYYVSCLYLANKKLVEALSLLKYTENLLAITNSRYLDIKKDVKKFF